MAQVTQVQLPHWRPALSSQLLAFPSSVVAGIPVSTSRSKPPSLPASQTSTDVSESMLSWVKSDSRLGQIWASAPHNAKSTTHAAIYVIGR